MAEKIGSVVVGEIVSTTKSVLINKYDAHAAIDDKLERLEMLVIKIHSAVEASQHQHIEDWWLRRWQWKLIDAACEGDDVLRAFRQRAAPERAGSADAGSSFAVSLRNMAKRVRTAAKRLFSSDEDVDKLNTTLERLEKVSSDIGDFLRLLKLEVRRSRTSLIDRSRSRPQDHLESVYAFRICIEDDWVPLSYSAYIVEKRQVHLLIMKQKIRQAVGKFGAAVMAPFVMRVQRADTQMQPDRLQELVTEIRKAVQTVDGRQMDSVPWLMQWHDKLQDVAGRGDDELSGVAERAKRMAAELGDFRKLVAFCTHHGDWS